MSEGGFDKAGLVRLGEVADGHVADDDVPGLAWLVSRGDAVEVGVAGTTDEGGSGKPVARDSIFRIASMTKPVSAVAALILVEECTVRLDQPVHDLLPELADRQVLVDPQGPLDATVPAERPITLRDLLTFRFGLGMDFTRFGHQPMLDAIFATGIWGGPPAPQGPPEPDEWMRRLGALPLEFQPGERWLYHLGADVLGVLIARAAGQPLERFLRERIFEPLGMKDTGFSVPAADLNRFGPGYMRNFTEGGRDLYDPADGQWATPPAFCSAGGGLVSTVDDYFAFADMLRNRGTRRGGARIVSPASVAAMTTDHLTDAQRAAGPLPHGVLGWGFGVGVQLRRIGPARSVGSYGWDGGLGSSWANDPAEDLIGIILTNHAFDSPLGTTTIADFWTTTYAALA